MHKRFEIIVNPIAGVGVAQALVERLAHRLRTAGHRVGVFRTQAPGDARQHASGLTTAHVDAVLIAGGDGTISEAIDGYVSPAGQSANGDDRPPLAILPIGTENLLGKLLKIRPSIDQAEATLLAGQPRRFDVAGLARAADRGDAWDVGGGPRRELGHFSMVAGVGFDADVVHLLAAKRSGNISYFDYVWPIAHTLGHYTFPAIEVEVDGEAICRQPCLVFIGNIPRYALGLPICQRAVVDDGLLDVVVFKCSHYGQLVMHSLRTIFGRHVGHRDVIYRQGRRAVVRSDRPVALEVDGDDCGQLPAEFSMSGCSVRLLVPPAKK